MADMDSEALKAALEAAKRTLKILRVIQRECKAALNPGFTPTIALDLEAVGVQTKFVPARHRVHTIKANQEGRSASLQVVEFQIDAAARFVHPSAAASTANIDESVASELVLAEITAVYSSLYVFDHCENEVLAAFGATSAGWHVWPYWREFLAAQCARMDLPTLTLGMYRVRDSADDSIDLKAMLAARFSDQSPADM